VILDTIIRSAESRAALLPPFVMMSRGDDRVRRSLADAIAGRSTGNAVIGEIKFASPSRGRISAYEDPVRIARDYVAGGCTAVSVLTEPDFFSGSTESLVEVRAAVGVPVLRKDFIVDMRQLAETAEIGADAVLLIARVLGERLVDFVGTSFAMGIEPLVEIHTREEALLAIASGARLIGINNRDLRTMKTDLSVTRELSPVIRGGGRVVVSESGIERPHDAGGLKEYCDAFLIGTAIMGSGDRRKRMEEFVCA
jgi:indole-3-glycerol phosphate synthase